MALPPRGDPRRPLALAVRSTRTLGIVFLVLAAMSMLPMLLVLRRNALGSLPLVLAGSITYLVPGMLNLVCSTYLARRRFWAIVLGLVITGIQLLFVIAGLAGVAIVAITTPTSNVPRQVWLIMAGILVLFLLAFAQLIYHLSRCFEAIKYAPLDEAPGFEVVHYGQ